jgi:hypothetical protein
MALTDSRNPAGSINLLPQEVQSGQRTNRIFRIVVISAAAIVGLLVLITVVQRIRIASAQRDLEDRKATVATLTAQVEALREFELLKQSIDANRGALAAALAGDIDWALFLDRLDENMPSDSWISSVSATSGAGTSPLGDPSVGTATFGATVRTYPGLANWLDTMSEVDGFTFVYFGSGSKSEEGVAFSVNANLGSDLFSNRCQTETASCP